MPVLCLILGSLLSVSGLLVTGDPSGHWFIVEMGARHDAHAVFDVCDHLNCVLWKFKVPILFSGANVHRGAHLTLLPRYMDFVC